MMFVSQISPCTKPASWNCHKHPRKTVASNQMLAPLITNLGCPEPSWTSGRTNSKTEWSCFEERNEPKMSTIMHGRTELWFWRACFRVASTANCQWQEVEDGLEKGLSGLGPDFILEFRDQKSETTKREIAISGKSANHRRLYWYFMVIEYGQKNFFSTVLQFVDIRHGLHKWKKELNVVRLWHEVLSVIEEFPKNGMEKTQRQLERRRADYMVCTHCTHSSWPCFVCWGTFEDSHHSKELPPFAGCISSLETR